MADIKNALAVAQNELVTYTNDELEGYISIGTDRIITVPDSLKRIAVQYDHNMETVTFVCPRYWDHHDMSTMNVYINYLLPNSVLGSYRADNVRISESNSELMLFDWTVSRNLTGTAGNISICVCVKRTDDDGYETNHWNTEINKELTVSEGLESTESVVEKYPDIINQILTDLNAVNDILEGDLETILTDEVMQEQIDKYLDEHPIVDVVKYSKQELTDAEKKQARDNIGVAGSVGSGFFSAQFNLGRAEGYNSFAGNSGIAKGSHSVAFGQETIAIGDNQLVIGSFNKAESDYYFIIGGAGGEEFRSNLHTVDYWGNAWYSGKVFIGSSKKELSTKEYVDTNVKTLSDKVNGVYSKEDTDKLLQKKVDQESFNTYIMSYEPIIPIAQGCEVMGINVEDLTASVTLPSNTRPISVLFKAWQSGSTADDTKYITYTIEPIFTLSPTTDNKAYVDGLKDDYGISGYNIVFHRPTNYAKTLIIKYVVYGAGIYSNI